MNYRLFLIVFLNSPLCAVPFLWEAIKHPGQVGALFQFSEATGNELVRFLKEHKGAKRILELGPGEGGTTKVLCQHLGPQDQLDLVEIDPEFCVDLQKKFDKKKYPNLKIYCMDVVKFKANQPYDFIICTIPLTMLEPGTLACLQEKIKTWTKSGAYFSYVEYMFLLKARKIFAHGANHTILQQRETLLENFKKRYLVRTEKIFGNLPPTYVHHLKF